MRWKVVLHFVIEIMQKDWPILCQTTQLEGRRSHQFISTDFKAPKCLMWPIHTSQGYLWRCLEIIQPVAEFYIFFSCWYMTYNVPYNQRHLRLDECRFAIGRKGLWLYNPTALSYRRRNMPPTSNASLSPLKAFKLPVWIDEVLLFWWASYSGLELFCLKIAKWLRWETKKLEETLCDGKNKSQRAFEQL